MRGRFILILLIGNVSLKSLLIHLHSYQIYRRIKEPTIHYPRYFPGISWPQKAIADGITTLAQEETFNKLIKAWQNFWKDDFDSFLKRVGSLLMLRELFNLEESKLYEFIANFPEESKIAITNLETQLAPQLSRELLSQLSQIFWYIHDYRYKEAAKLFIHFRQKISSVFHENFLTLTINNLLWRELLFNPRDPLTQDNEQELFKKLYGDEKLAKEIFLQFIDRLLREVYQNNQGVLVHSP